MITMQDIFLFERTGVVAERQGASAASAPPASGRSARDRLAASGRPLPPDMFEHVQQVA